MTEQQAYFERVREARKDKKISQQALADMVGLSKSAISMFETGNSALTTDNFIKICAALGIDPGETLTGRPFSLAEPHSEYHTTMKANKPEALEAVPILEFTRGIEKRHESQDIPLYDITAAAGLNALYNSQNNILDYMRIPNLPRCDGAIYVKGDSMYPLLKHGDMVAFQQITDIPDDIIFGEMYVIDISTPSVERIVVKYLQPSAKGDDFIQLKSYNEKHHPPKDIPLSKIKGIALVKASVRLS